MRDEGLTNSDIATALGIGETIVSKLVQNKTRNVQTETLTRAIQTLRIDANFFFAPELGKAPRYRDHLRKQRQSLPYWDEFVTRYSRIGELDEDDLERLQNVITNAHAITSWQSWASLASWYLDHRPQRASA